MNKIEQSPMRRWVAAGIIIAMLGLAACGPVNADVTASATPTPIPITDCGDPRIPSTVTVLNPKNPNKTEKEVKVGEGMIPISQLEEQFNLLNGQGACGFYFYPIGVTNDGLTILGVAP